MIDIEDVSMTLADNEVLTGVSVSVGEGEFVGLIGPNGAGKTTLLRTITGVLSPSTGVVRVDGDPVEALSSREASRRIAVVPQDTTLSFEFDVRQVVEMGRHPHRSRFRAPDADDADAVDRAMERVGVARFADRSIDDVSGGERQRVIVARALAQATPALLLDEPTASLDVTAKVELLSLARELADDGKTVLAAIHDLDLAARFCDRLALLSDGSVVAAGPPNDVLETDALAAAFGGRPAVGRSPVTGQPTVTALRHRDDLDRRVHVFGTGAETARTLATLFEHGAEVSVGPVPDSDVAAVAGRALGAETVTASAFGTPDEAGDALDETVSRADVAVAVEGVGVEATSALAGTPLIALEGADIDRGERVLPEDLVETVADPPGPVGRQVEPSG